MLETLAELELFFAAFVRFGLNFPAFEMSVFFVLSIISVGLVCESCDVKMVSVQLYMYIDL